MASPWMNDIGYDEDDQAKELEEHLQRIKLAEKSSPSRQKDIRDEPGYMQRENGPLQRRRRSFNSEEDVSLEGAVGPTSRRRSWAIDKEEVSKEIQELLSRGIINQEEAESLQHGQEMQLRLNWATSNEGSQNRPPPFDSDGIPVNWSQDAAHLRESRAPYMLVELQPGDNEYDQIYSEMSETGLDITQVVKLQNIHLLDRFKAEMEEILRRRSRGFDLNIRYLYHGTTVNRKNLCEEGLDQRLSRMGFFGKGIYFSDNPLKCVNYANSEEQVEANLLKCRVILGSQKCYAAGAYDTSLKREPEKEKPSPGEWRFYDSVLGCPKDYNEFVVYENRRAMIEYIITFKVNQQGKSALRAVSASPTNYSMTYSSDIQSVQEEEDHFERISAVREDIRRKRCQEKGIPYTPPDVNKRKQDKEMWTRLQKLHMPESDTAQTTPPVSGSQSSLLSFPSSTNVTQQSVPAQKLQPPNQDLTASSPDDAVHQVTSLLLSNFLEVTSCDSIQTAKYYLERNDMDVNKALIEYYDNIP